MALFLLQKKQDRLQHGLLGSYPEHVSEPLKGGREKKLPINESLTRPWIKHWFFMRVLPRITGEDDIVARDKNLLDVFKTTIPLSENSFRESGMSSWRMFIDSAFRDSDAPWYRGIKKTLVPDRFYSAIEHLELEVPSSNPQRLSQFRDHEGHLREIPRVPIKLLFSIAGNEREKLVDILRQALNNNPHNIDVAFLSYSFLKAWNRSVDFLEISRSESRNDLVEWYYWVENDLRSIGNIKREIRDFGTSFFIYDRAQLSSAEYKEVADWFLRESEFKAAYHFYYKAKEFETALELLQNVSVKEFGELTNLRRSSKGEKSLDLLGEPSRIATMYQDEIETLRGFTRIRAAEMYREISVKARQHFDRETIETKYAFGELSEDEYQRLIHQLQERKQ